MKNLFLFVSYAKNVCLEIALFVLIFTVSVDIITNSKKTRVSGATCQVLRVRCYVSGVTCQVLRVRCYVLRVTIKSRIKYITILFISTGEW